MDEVKTARTKPEEDILVVSDGYIRIPVYNQLKEQIGLFKFSPTDVNIVNRYNEVANKFDEVIQPLNDASITAEGEAADDESVAILNEAEDRMIELFDYLLGTDSREAFFSRVHAFTPIDGNFYCENVFKSLGAFLEKKYDKELNKLDARIEKHVHGYRTGKHRRGRR